MHARRRMHIYMYAGGCIHAGGCIYTCTQEDAYIHVRRRMHIRRRMHVEMNAGNTQEGGCKYSDACK